KYPEAADTINRRVTAKIVLRVLEYVRTGPEGACGRFAVASSTWLARARNESAATWFVGFSPFEGLSRTSETGATKRYPFFGTVSIYCCPSSILPSSLRNAEMLTVRLASSTKLSGHTFCINSSLLVSFLPF